MKIKKEERRTEVKNRRGNNQINFKNPYEESERNNEQRNKNKSRKEKKNGKRLEEG